MPDIITLQEIWDFQHLESIRGLPYHCITANDFHGGGLATLIHWRHAARAKMHVERHDHWLGVSVKVRDKRLVAVVNIHITPHMDKDLRNQICVESRRFLRGANTAIQMLQGDVNADMCTTWFKQALGPKGPWSFLLPPYRAGTPTNTVRNHRRVSHKVTDWLLLSDTTPCDKCEWTILPGLSTHYALLFSLHYSTSVLRPADPAHKQFQFAATTKEQMDKAAAVVSVGLYWCLYGDWTPDATIKLYWELIKHAVRRKSDVTTISGDAQEVVAIATSANEEDKERVKAWWTKKQDAAMAASIGVDMHRLKGTNITSQTARVLRISS